MGERDERKSAVQLLSAPDAAVQPHDDRQAVPLISPRESVLVALRGDELPRKRHFAADDRVPCLDEL